MPQTPSTRWCPTPEQLMILEEMYRSGVRTPNASQIQQITAHLSFYGKIEGKNVFYWFQNHKARDRQKLRRRLSRQQQQQHQFLHPTTSHQLPLHFHNLELDQASNHPTSPHYHHHHHHHMTTTTQPPLPHFLHQGGSQEANQGMNLLYKLETGEASTAPSTSSMPYNGYEWMMMMSPDSSAVSFPPCCRPLKTLELFPTKSTGLKDECSTSKSSSCSTSTN